MQTANKIESAKWNWFSQNYKLKSWTHAIFTDSIFLVIYPCVFDIQIRFDSIQLLHTFFAFIFIIGSIDFSSFALHNFTFVHTHTHILWVEISKWIIPNGIILLNKHLTGEIIKSPELARLFTFIKNTHTHTNTVSV